MTLYKDSASSVNDPDVIQCLELIFGLYGRLQQSSGVEPAPSARAIGYRTYLPTKKDTHLDP
jgi:hypothetical protein